MNQGSIYNHLHNITDQGFFMIFHCLHAPPPFQTTCFDSHTSLNQMSICVPSANRTARSWTALTTTLRENSCKTKSGLSNPAVGK